MGASVLLKSEFLTPRRTLLKREALRTLDIAAFGKPAESGLGNKLSDFVTLRSS
jgi:hypothetical protein